MTSTKPSPPASTTPARRSTGLMFCVSASASRAAASSASSMPSKSVLSLAKATAACAPRRLTVRIVPSAGFMTAL